MDTDNNTGNKNPIEWRPSLIFIRQCRRRGWKWRVYEIRLKLKLVASLGDTAFQAEMHAIELCLRDLLNIVQKGSLIYILSDIKASLLAISALTINFKLVLKCLNVLQYIAHHNTVTLIWVPEHVGIESSEKAGEIAREGAPTPKVQSRTFCTIFLKPPKSSLNEWVQQSAAKQSYSCQAS